MCSYLPQNKPNLWQSSRLFQNIIKLLILFGLSFYLFNQISNQKITVFKNFNLQTINASPYYFGFIIILVPINLLLEVQKWRILSGSAEDKISIFQGFQSVISGFALSYLLPFGMGDVIGRSFNQAFRFSKNRVKGTLVGGGIQFLVSLFFGTLALFCFKQQTKIPLYLNLLFWASFLSLIIFTLIFNLKTKPWIFNILTKNNFSKLFFDELRTIPINLFWKATLWASIRYLVFCLQMYCSFRLMNITLPIFSLMVNINLIFYAKSIVPSFNFLGDLGVREAASTYFFSFYNINPLAVISASFLIWLVNVLFPMILGILNIGYQFLKSRKV